MRKNKLITIFLLMVSLALAACGGGDDSASGDAESGSVGNAANGERLFNESIIGAASAPGCITCHSLEPGVTLVGPAQNDVGARAGTRVEGLSAEEYLRQSIVEPNAYIVEGFTEGVMYQTYGEELTTTQINDLVAFMLTLE